MTFTYTENMMVDCLLANGFSRGWDGVRWVHSGINADYCDYSLKEAFSILLTSKNLYGKQWESSFKLS